MQKPLSLKSTERKAFQTSFADGLWDVLIGCFVLLFALAPLLSAALGDFWGSMIFLPFWGLVYLAIRLARKALVAPRLGTVRFGDVRKQKLRTFTHTMLAVNLLVFVFGLAVFVVSGAASGWMGSLGGMWINALLGLFWLAGFSFAAYLLDFPRLYLYALLLGVAPLVGEWLYQHHGATHHGYPIAFGAAAALMILTGLALFVRLLIHTPVVDVPEAGN